MNEALLLETAMMLAAVSHMHQVDKQGEPYVIHLMSVACYPVMTLKQRTCALLHDILEDTDTTVERLLEYFPEDYVKTIVALTHNKTETRDEYYARVKANPDALVVKLADIAHNQSRLSGLADKDTRTRLAIKYAHALEALS